MTICRSRRKKNEKSTQEKKQVRFLFHGGVCNRRFRVVRVRDCVRWGYQMKQFNPITTRKEWLEIFDGIIGDREKDARFIADRFGLPKMYADVFRHVLGRIKPHPKVPEEKKAQIIKLYNQGVKTRDIMRITGVRGAAYMFKLIKENCELRRLPTLSKIERMRVVAMRRKGNSYEEIGMMLGRSGNAARQIYNRWKYKF